MRDHSTLCAAVAAHGHVVRVVVLSVQGSAPRETGAAMLVWQGGQSGTIGGGALEWQAAARARGLHGTLVERLALGPNLGQCCGGAVTLGYEAFTRETLPAPGPYLRRLEGDKPAPQGDFTWKDGWLYEAPADLQPLVIYGAGHVGLALQDVLTGLPLAVTLADTRIAALPDPITAMAQADNSAWHVILTHDHAQDLELCHRLLQRPFGWAGLIGSASKWARFQGRLRALGHGDAEIARIICPIGEPGLGKSPKTIAIGVARALLLTLSKERGAM
jgi:xanthine dehydrogenase accessory factor